MSAANCCCKRKQNNDVKSTIIVSNLRWVIFPGDYWVKHWDGLIITLTIILMFVIPFQIGVSFGSYLFESMGWLVTFSAMNAIFFIDNFIYFFRAYRNENGVLILDLKKIRRNYLRTYCIPNFLSTTPTTLIFYLCHLDYAQLKTEHSSLINLLVWLLPLCKVLRFIRIPALLQSSQFVKDFRARYNSQNIALLGYLFFLIFTSHIFACTWSFVALLQASIDAPLEELISTPNWISYWYNNSYEPGSLNPADPDSFLDRYILSLFWAVQTITSIGYGNVLPFTTAEYFVSSALMLLSGIVWAYIIGDFPSIIFRVIGCFLPPNNILVFSVSYFFYCCFTLPGSLVGVAAGLGREGKIYGNRLDEASELIKDFDFDEDQKDDDFKSLKLECSRRIRSYIHTQKARSQNKICISTVFETYPVLPSLSPDLQLTSSFIVMRRYLDAVPYLSSKYLTMDEQSEVAMQCVFVDFAAGERVIPRRSVGHLGAGVLVMGRGLAVRRRNPGFQPTRVVAGGMPFGENSVLLEDELLSATEDELRYVTFSRVVFIPRKAILNALRSEIAWKECGRWRYLIALILSQKDSHLHDRKHPSREQRNMIIEKLSVSSYI